jgi:Ca2+-binding RTX toxin-like protein
MALPIIRKLFDSPLPDGDGSLEDSLESGMFQPATDTRFEVGIPGQVTTVFKGSFTVSGGEVTGGTITGYVTHLGETKMLEASGFNLDAATTIAAIEAFQGGDFDAYFTTFYANDTAKKVVGSRYSDDLYVAGDGSVGLGKAGNDELSGNTYGITRETLKGGQGDDELRGNGGGDLLYGGRGDDAFYLDGDDLASSPVRIKDFEPGSDSIVFQIDEGEGFESVNPGYLPDAQFHIGKSAKTDEQVIIYDRKTGALFYDADGSGTTEQVQIAKLSKKLDLSAHDFFGDPLL